MPKQDLLYHFQAAEDLTGKKDEFHKVIDDMAAFDTYIYQVITACTNDSSGKIIKKIRENAKTRHDTIQIYHDAYKTVMTNMAKQYTDHINDIKEQDITFYYDIIKKEVSGSV
ncbi:hypothetical protein [Metabacillus fastidiosus]|uniref:hypothetical protein n=1 Tax=Metabacillus fastidiosus TaxID=1458 RepID=UPI002E1F9A7B|nr:hypothetical protein [Metabacillus fastidiosus]